MATEPSQPPLPVLSLSDLTVRDAQGDLLELEPLEMGPGSPASAALAAERGPEPAERGDQ